MLVATESFASVGSCRELSATLARHLRDIGFGRQYSGRHERERKSRVEDTFGSDPVQEMEDYWPSGVDLRG